MKTLRKFKYTATLATVVFSLDVQFYMPETTRQARHEFITGRREEGIRVKVSGVSVQNTEWRHAALEAIDIWNAVPDCRVHFNKIELQILSAEVRIEDRHSLSGNTVAVGAIPKGGKPGGNVHIDNEYDYYNYYQKLYIMVHELGHVLGLAHTDMITKNPAWHIWGTPDWSIGEEDDDSVMRSGTGGRYWGEWGWENGYRRGRFTPGDILAIQNMYGAPEYRVSIGGPAVLFPGERATYELSCPELLQGYIDDFQTTWTV